MNAGQDQDRDHGDEDGDYLLTRCGQTPRPCDRPVSLKQQTNAEYQKKMSTKQINF
jgi:hypothetical protein